MLLVLVWFTEPEDAGFGRLTVGAAPRVIAVRNEAISMLYRASEFKRRVTIRETLRELKLKA